MHNFKEVKKLDFKKIILVLIILLVASLSVASVSAGLFGDDVTVKEMTLNHYNGYKSEDSYDMIYSLIFVSNVDIDHITDIWLQNVEVKYSNETLSYDNAKITFRSSDADNIALTEFDSLVKENQYQGRVLLKDVNTVDRLSVNHIKGDIVVNTTTQNNIVVGHIDNDISCDKLSESSSPRGGQWMPK